MAIWDEVLSVSDLVDAGDVSTLIDLSSRDRTLSERIVCFLSYPRFQVPILSKAKPFLDSAFSTTPCS
jgi:hypothetical protein